MRCAMRCVHTVSPSCCCLGGMSWFVSARSLVRWWRKLWQAGTAVVRRPADLLAESSEGMEVLPFLPFPVIKWKTVLLLNLTHEEAEVFVEPGGVEDGMDPNGTEDGMQDGMIVGGFDTQVIRPQPVSSHCHPAPSTCLVRTVETCVQ